LHANTSDPEALAALKMFVKLERNPDDLVLAMTAEVRKEVDPPAEVCQLLAAWREREYWQNEAEP
jgi:hypothetical protein